MIRLYRHGEFHHLAECLYLQRVHSANTQVRPKTNAFIQAQTVAYYQESVDALASAWAGRNGLAEVTLRVAGVLQPDRDPVGKVVELDPDRRLGLPFADGEVGAIHAVEVLQHVADRAAFFNECYRVLTHGGLLLTETPSTDGRGAFQDPSHRSWWNENSFWYLTQAALRPAIADLCARFQVSHLRTWFPTPWHEQIHIPYVQANLLAVKEGARQGGPLLC